MGGEMVPGITVTLGESRETTGVAREMLLLQEYNNKRNQQSQTKVSEPKQNKTKNKQNPNKQ